LARAKVVIAQPHFSLVFSKKDGFGHPH
jgi:hypothetical protein